MYNFCDIHMEKSGQYIHCSKSFKVTTFPRVNGGNWTQRNISNASDEMWQYSIDKMQFGLEMSMTLYFILYRINPDLSCCMNINILQLQLLKFKYILSEYIEGYSTGSIYIVAFIQLEFSTICLPGKCIIHDKYFHQSRWWPLQLNRISVIYLNRDLVLHIHIHVEKHSSTSFNVEN